MKSWLFVTTCLSFGIALAGCGGSGGSATVSSVSLQPRLPGSSEAPGFAVQRTLDWSDPVNLVGQGLSIPQRTQPSAAVQEFKDSHFRGAAGEVLAKGSGLNATEVRVGVAQFNSEADANRVRDWMHSEDLRQPCYSQCIFTPHAATVAGIPSARYVFQTSKAPPPPSGLPPGVKPPPGVKLPRAVAQPGPTNYSAQFTIGPYLYWMGLQAEPSAKAKFEAGVKAYYAHARKAA